MVNYLREGRHTVTPRLITSDVAGLVDFIRVVFDAQGDHVPDQPVELKSPKKRCGTYIRGMLIERSNTDRPALQRLLEDLRAGKTTRGATATALATMLRMSPQMRQLRAFGQSQGNLPVRKTAMPKAKRCIICDAARHRRTSVTDQLVPAGGFREGDRLTAVGIAALGDALSVA